MTDGKRARNSPAILIVVATVVTGAGILLLDMLMPLGVAAGVPYVGLVLISLYSPWRHYAIFLAIFSTVLIVLGYVLSSPLGIPWVVIVNRLLAVLVVWMTAEFCRRRIQAEARLYSQVELRQIFLDALPPLAMLLQRHTREIVACNKAGLKFGVQPGRTCYETWGKSDRPCAYCQVEDMWETGQAQHSRLEEHGKFFDVHWIPVSDDLYLHYVCDITDQHQAQEALRESEAKYSDLYENSPDMMCSVDARTAEIIQCNGTLARVLGYSREEILGNPVFDLYHPESLASARTAFDTFVTTGEVCDRELQLKRIDGSALDVSLNVTAVRDDGGEILHSRSVWRDITDRRQAERDMKMANQILEAKHQALQKKNQLMKGILEQIGIEKSEVEERISANLLRLVRPTLRLLRQRVGNIERDLVDRVDSGLRDIASPFASRLESAYAKLTPREIEVCNLIREGLSSKEVADTCNVSVETVGEWRKRVRRKLGISNQQVNLASFLKSVSNTVPKQVPESGFRAADQGHNN